MIEVPISNLPAAALPLAGTEQFPLVQLGVTVRAPVSNIVSAAGGSPIGAIWVNPVSVVLTPTTDVVCLVSNPATIAEVVIFGQGGVGSCQIDIYKANLSSHYPPISADSITGGVPPAIVAGNLYRNSSLVGWIKSLAADDVLLFHLISSSIFNYVQIQLRTV